MKAPSSNPSEPVGKVGLALYLGGVAVLVGGVAWLDEWTWPTYLFLLAFMATAGSDRVPRPTARSLGLGLLMFSVLCGAVRYMPDIWFGIAFRLNHASHYLWNANAFMARLPWNDGRFLWGHRWAPLSRLMLWVYLTGFDMVVWVPVVRSLLAFDTRKVARYALAAHIIQFPLIIPFYTAIRVDEVWSVLGDADRCARGWTDEVRRDLGANCFPSMHTSVAFAILLLSLREKNATFRYLMVAYASSIIVSTVYMEIHWLVDVAGGIALAGASVWLTDRLLRKLGRGAEAVEDPVTRDR